MDIAILVVFLLLGVFFLILEIFLLPGFGIGGIAGIAFIVASVWYSFAHIGMTAGWITLVSSIFLFVAGIWLFMKTRMLERISLKSEIDGVANQPIENVSVGDIGIARTRLAPMGHVRFDENDIEVKSEDGFIDQGTKVIITEFSSQHVVVRTYLE